MVRLTIQAQTPEETVLEVHGWVSGENVTILEDEGTRLLGESQRLVLDLKGVQFIDADGIALLERWSGERLTLRNGLPFIRALLERHRLV